MDEQAASLRLFEAAAQADQSTEVRLCNMSNCQVTLHVHVEPNDMHVELLMQVEQLLQQGADAAYQDEETGCSCLMHAAKHGCLSNVKQLLAAGAPWSATDRQGLCAGDHAIAGGHEDTAAALLDAGEHARLPCCAPSCSDALDMQLLPRELVCSKSARGKPIVDSSACREQMAAAVHTCALQSAPKADSPAGTPWHLGWEGRPLLQSLSAAAVQAQVVGEAAAKRADSSQVGHRRSNPSSWHFNSADQARLPAEVLLLLNGRQLTTAFYLLQDAEHTKGTQAFLGRPWTPAIPAPAAGVLR